MSLETCSHRTYSKFHALCASSSQFPRYNHLASLGSTLHNKPQHTVTGSPHSQTIQQLVAERFALSDSRKATVLDFGSIERDGVLRELKALLDERSELADTAPLLAKHFLGMCCANDCEMIKMGDRGMGSAAY